MHDKPVESMHKRHSPVREVVGTDARPQGWLVQRAWLETDDVNAHRSHKNREGSEICSWVTRNRPHLNAAARVRYAHKAVQCVSELRTKVHEVEVGDWHIFDLI